MSASDDGPGQREVAYRLFAAEYDAADCSYSEGDEDRAPNYVVTPTGARINRAFVVGVLTEVEQVSEDVLRARVVDPTGAFVLYAGQYQPDEQAFLDRAETPTFVAVTGKARTFEPDDGDRVYTSLRPETINEVDADTRDRWTVATAERTLQRVGLMAAALARTQRGDDLAATLAAEGIDEGLASGIAIAIEHYDTSPAYLANLRDMALEAARLVAGDADEVSVSSLSPDAPGERDLDELAALADTSVADRDRATADPAQTTSETAQATSETAQATSGTEQANSSGTEQASADSTADSGTVGATATAEETASAGDTTASTTGDETGEVGDFEPGEFELDEEEREEIEEEFGTEFQSGTEVDEPGEADIETPESDVASETTTEATSETTPAVEEPAGQESVGQEPVGQEPVGQESVGQEPAGQESVGQESAVEGSTTDEPTAAEATPDDASGIEGTDTVDETESDADVVDESETETEAVDESEEPAEEDIEDINLEDATVETMTELDDGDGADREDVIETVTDRYSIDRADVEEAIQNALMDGRCYEPEDGTLKPI